MKICTGCKLEKDEAEFSPRRDRPIGLRAQCKICSSKAVIRYCNTKDGKEKRRKYRQQKHRLAKRREYENQDVRLKFNRRQLLNKKYGISPEDHDRMLETQEYKCAICKTSNPKGPGNKLHIDHCHETGKARGLLCSRCNIGIGKFKDSIQILGKVIEYLKNPPGVL